MANQNPPPGPKSWGVEVYGYQLEGAAMALMNMLNDWRGAVIAYPPGSGKTLTALIAISKIKADCKLPSIIVCPADAIPLWVSEIKRLLRTAVKFCVLSTATKSSHEEILGYKIIVASYEFVIEDHKSRSFCLKEVSLCLGFQAMIQLSSQSTATDGPRLVDTKYPILVIDEAHFMKDTNTLIYEALESLRMSCKDCIMLTDTPIEDNWRNIYALSEFLKGPSLWSLEETVSLFAPAASAKARQDCIPQGESAAKVHEFLKQWIFTVPENAIVLPALREEIVKFRLTTDELNASNDSYKQYQASLVDIDADVKDSKDVEESDCTEDDEEEEEHIQDKIALYKAQQHSYHPALIEVMNFMQNAENEAKTDAEVTQKFSETEMDAWKSWCNDLRENENWQSSRIRAIISEHKRWKLLQPDAKVLIFSDSIFFLDIVEIALNAMPNPIQCNRFDPRINGRDDTEARDKAISTFNATRGYAIMLLTPDLFGLGRSLTKATVVILCGPFCSATQEERAFKQAYRRGQSKPANVVRLFAEGCDVESARANLRDENKKFRDEIMKRLIEGKVE